MNTVISDLISKNIELSENIETLVQLPILNSDDNEPTLQTTDESKSMKSELIGKFQEKCGEIYVENGKYYLICQFCTENHDNLDLFIEHISTEHLVLHNESEDSDNDSCCLSPDMDDLSLNKIINETLPTTNSESFLNNYDTSGNLDMLNISYEDDDDDENILQKPENISCEPDTGIFFHDMFDNSEEPINNMYETQINDVNNQDSNVWNNMIKEENHTNNIVNDNMQSISKRYYCGFCDKNYSYSKSLKEHIEIIHIKTEKLFKCPTCDKAFSKQWKLNTHLKVHTDERPFVCTLCVMSFKWKKNLQRHLIRVHSVKYSDLMYEMSRDKNLNANNNSNDIDIKNSLIGNQNEQYPIIKNLLLTNNQSSPPAASSSSTSLLPTNSIDFDGNTNLDNNEFTVNDNINNLYSSNNFNNNVDIDENNIPISNNIKIEENNDEQLLINNYFNNKTIYDKNPDFLNQQLFNVNYKEPSSSSSIMNNDGMYACRLCNKVYVRKDSLKSHEKIHTSGIACNICDKPFTHQFFLDRHMKTHKSNVKNDKIFVCNVCSDILPDESSLRRHIKFHFKKTYACRCGKVFNIRKDYRSHRKLCRII